MQIRRLTAAAVAGLALLGLAGCRTAPNVAAYVGDEQVSVAELDRAVDERLADPAIEQFAAGDRASYERRVLGILVQDEIDAAAARRYGVEVTDAQVRARLGEVLGPNPEEAYANAASSQGLSRQDAFLLVRQELTRRAIAAEEGLDEPLSDEALRQRYEQSLADRTTVQLGLIAVPDQRTADQFEAALEANPDRYAALAERFPGQATLPEPQEVTADQLATLPEDVQRQVADAEPGSAFATEIPGAGTVVVLVGEAPSFEELEPQLRQEAESDVFGAAQELVQDVRDDLGVTINPRYGELGDDGTISPSEDGVVTFLEG